MLKRSAADAFPSKFLAELDLGESDVLEWAAAQVRRGGGSGRAEEARGRD